MLGDQDFYPTPQKLASLMVAYADLDKASTVLEPSAGSGALAEVIRDRFRYGARQELHCIEINPHLQATLTGKGFSVVHDDFLSFETRERYDRIIANFPFSSGADHLMKALRLLEGTGGRLVCLVNAETIRNPYTSARSSLVHWLGKLGADIEYIENAFVDADRPTDVEVALITVDVPRTIKESVILEGMQDAHDVEWRVGDASQVVDADPSAAMVARFNLEADAGVRLIEEWEALKPYMLDSIDAEYSTPIIELQINSNRSSTPVNSYLKGLRRKYWRALIGNDRFRSMFTTAMLKDLDSRMDELERRDFSAFNIRWLERELRMSVVSGIEDSILEIFDTLSVKWAHYDGCKNNVHYFNGWKTNKAHKINNKVILPINGFNSWSWGERKLQKFGWAADTMRDIVQVFRYLSGDPIDASEIVNRQFELANAVQGFRNIDFEYFTATFYKKGTVHLRFKNQELLDKLNIYGARNRGWLPPSYGKAAYQDMSTEERAVIDDFQGETDYAVVMARSDFYLSSQVDSGMLALAGGGL